MPGLLAGRSTGLVTPGYTGQQLTGWAVGRLSLSSHNSLDISQHSSHLTSLDLESTGALNQGCGEVHEEESSCSCPPALSFPLLLAGLARLTELNLFACRGLHSAALRALADSCPALTRLNIDEVRLLGLLRMFLSSTTCHLSPVPPHLVGR